MMKYMIDHNIKYDIPDIEQTTPLGTIKNAAIKASIEKYIKKHNVWLARRLFVLIVYLMAHK